MTGNSALSFVGEINTEHRETCKAESNALQHAIKCGELLTLAKENVKAEKGKWLPWLKEHCPEIPQTTASLYMRLAENKDDLGDAKSIREAIGLLPKGKRKPGNQESNEEEEKEEEDEESAEASSGAKKRDDLLVETLRNLAPDELCASLIEAWDADLLQELEHKINSHLRNKRVFASLGQAVQPN